jgi:hypothetical protein
MRYRRGDNEVTVPTDTILRETLPAADLAAAAAGDGIVALAAGEFPWWPNYSARPFESIVHSIRSTDRRTARLCQGA